MCRTGRKEPNESHTFRAIFDFVALIALRSPCNCHESLSVTVAVRVSACRPHTSRCPRAVACGMESVVSANLRSVGVEIDAV